MSKNFHSVLSELVPSVLSIVHQDEGDKELKALTGFPWGNQIQCLQATGICHMMCHMTTRIESLSMSVHKDMNKLCLKIL